LRHPATTLDEQRPAESGGLLFPSFTWDHHRAAGRRLALTDGRRPQWATA
jgi:hypothetical protein